MNVRQKLLFLFSVAFGVTLLDQITKYLIMTRMVPYQSIQVVGDWIRLTFIYNRNGIFGLKPHGLLPFLPPTVFFTLFSVIAASLLVYLFLKTQPGERWQRLALALVLGGAMGNGIDRLRFGQVVDFVDCEFPDFIMERFAVFNVADSGITVGVALLLFLSFIRKKNEPNPPGEPGA